jgi:hypothetical protein
LKHAFSNLFCLLYSAAQSGTGFGSFAQQGQNVFANQPSNTG